VYKLDAADYCNCWLEQTSRMIVTKNVSPSHASHTKIDIEQMVLDISNCEAIC
jgi:hypothetical protein